MARKRLSVVIDADTSGFDKSVKGMQGTMDKATGGISGKLKSLGGAFTGLVGSIGKIAGTLGVFKILDSLMNMISNSVSSAINRFDTLQNAERVFQNMGFEAGETKVMMDSLVDSITGLPTPMESAVQGVQQLASSTGDLEGSEKIYSALNNSVLGFGGSNEEVDRTVQMLSRSLQKGKVQGDEFNTMMDTMGPVMNAVAEEMGYTTSELQSGLSDGSINIDEFTDTLLRMNEEGGGGLVSLEQIARDSTGGIATSLANVQNAFNRGMASIIESINEALEDKGLPNISEMIQIFGQKAEAVFNKVSESIPPMIDWFSNLFSTISNSTAFQSLKEVVGTALDGIRDFSDSEAWENIKTALKDIGEAILEIDFGEIIADVGEFLDKWGPLIAGIAGAIGVFSALSTIIPIVVGAFKGLMFVIELVAMIRTLSDAVTLLGMAFPLLTNPITWVAVAIGALIAIGVALWKNWDEIKAKASEIWGAIKDYFAETWESIKTSATETWEGLKTSLSETWSSINESASNIWNGIKDYFSETWNSISTGASDAWEGIKEYLSGIWSGIVESVNEFFTPIGEFFSELWESVKETFTTTWETITAVLEVAWMFIQEMFGLLGDIILIPWNFIWENFSEPLTEAWEAVKSYLSEALSVITSWISETWESISSTTMEVWNGIKSFFVGLWDGIKNIFSTVGSAIASGISTVWNGIKTVTTTVWNGIKSFFSTVWNGIKSVIQTAINNVSNNISTVWNAIKSVTSAVWNGIKSVISTVWNAIKSVVSSAINTVKSVITTVWNTIKSVTSSIWNGVKSVISGVWTGIKSGVSSSINSVKSTVSRVFNSVKSTVTRIWNGIRDAIKKPINKARDIVKNAIDKIKGFMDFKWELPKLKMPSFSIEGKFGLNPPSVPSFGINWYATGGIATGPSVVGIGEAGDEAILPLSNKSKMKPFASAVASMMPNGGYGGNANKETNINVDTLVVREEADIKKIAHELKRLDDRESRSRGRRGLGN